jgi:phytoene synthase
VDPFDHCEAFVRARDEDRWLAARYAPPAGRRRLMALLAVHLEIARVPDQTREPPLGEIRLQWWREGLAGARTGRAPRHPALEALAAAELGDAAFDALGRAIDARARLLYADAFASAADLAGWLTASEAYLEPEAARLLCADEAPGAAASAALAYALARFRGLGGDHLYTDIAAEAARLLDAARSAEPFAPAAMPALAHLALAGAYLRPRGPGPAFKRLAIFLAVARGRICRRLNS